MAQYVGKYGCQRSIHHIPGRSLLHTAVVVCRLSYRKSRSKAKQLPAPPSKILFSSGGRRSKYLEVIALIIINSGHPLRGPKMMAPEYYTFTDRYDERIPRHITHVLIDKALKFVRARAFWEHPNIQEVICHDGVRKIEQAAFYKCPLRRVIMPGVKEVEQGAFNCCYALTYIECGKLEIVGERAFRWCNSLSSVDLPSIRIVESSAFDSCANMKNAKFGEDLESIGEGTFRGCPSLERIALPLKDGMISDDDVFQVCVKLNHIDLVEAAILSETVAALLLEEWKNDMNEEINSINQILPNTHGGTFSEAGGKAQAIRTWITSVLRKIIHYKAEHRRCLNVAAAALQPALPNDIVLKSIFPFIELPSHTFDGED